MSETVKRCSICLMSDFCAWAGATKDQIEVHLDKDNMAVFIEDNEAIIESGKCLHSEDLQKAVDEAKNYIRD